MKEEILNFSEHLKTFKTVKNSQRTRKIKIIKKGTRTSAECWISAVEIGDFTLKHPLPAAIVSYGIIMQSMVIEARAARKFCCFMKL